MSHSPYSEHSHEQRFKWLPPMGSWKFHALLGAIAIFILGPLGGVTATYMNFSLGFFVGGQVLAGILGSAVTYGYGAEGKHGANYMQTLAASVASMAGMAVLIQAMHWLGFEVPEAWKLMLYYLCIGMFGVGVGMLYTPLLVDKMRLTYPSGLAVANILRALTDKNLLKQSIGKLATGTGIGVMGGVAVEKLMVIQSTGISMSTFGAGMIVGARIALPAIIVGLIGDALIPTLVQAGWLQEGEPFRKIGFVIALGTILGAAIVDIALVAVQFVKKLKEARPAVAEADWKKVHMGRLVAWVVFWGAAVFFVAWQVFHQNPLFVLIAIALVFVFMLINGISLGISDSNPISSAFVLTVFVLAGVGLGDATAGLVCASILLISVSIGGDMQQDRSTGWRLSTNRNIQFRYQVIGVTMGAVLSVGMASMFMGSNPILLVDQTHKTEYLATLPEKERPQAEAEMKRWQSAMTYKFAGALDDFIGRPDKDAGSVALTQKEKDLLEASLAAPETALVKPPADLGTPEAKKAYAKALVDAKREKKKGASTMALILGISIGLVIEALRKLLRASKGYQAFKARGKTGFAVDFALDTVVLASPYASSFGGFVDFSTCLWFGIGGIFSSYSDTVRKEVKAAPTEGEAVPEDMSTNSLVGGGLIAGDSLAALGVGMAKLLT
jgi:hypothetical protein